MYCGHGSHFTISYHFLHLPSAPTRFAIVKLNVRQRWYTIDANASCILCRKFMKMQRFAVVSTANAWRECRPSTWPAWYSRTFVTASRPARKSPIRHPCRLPSCWNTRRKCVRRDYRAPNWPSCTHTSRLELCATTIAKSMPPSRILCVSWRFSLLFWRFLSTELNSYRILCAHSEHWRHIG